MLHFHLTRFRGCVWIAVISIVASGCMVGPDYHGPPSVTGKSSIQATFHRLPTTVASSAAPPLAAWWTALGDPLLDELETAALKASPTLAEAQARVRNARATVSERSAALLPTGGANAAYARIRIPPSAGSSITGGTSTSNSGSKTPDTNFYTAALDATWQLDFFGGKRRQVESARALSDYQQIELDDAQVTLTADVARAYANLRDAQQRLALNRAETDLLSQQLALTRQRRAGGTATDVDVESAYTSLKSTQADVLPLQGQVEIYSDQLAQLAGELPGAFDARLNAPATIVLPPAETAVGDPAALMRRRPDIRAAERQLASSNALIGYNVSQYFPSVYLVGTVGYSATSTSNFFNHNNLTYVAAPALVWNFLDFPAINAQVAEAKADLQRDEAAYRVAVLGALLDAENSLSRFAHQRDNVMTLADTVASAERAVELAKRRYASGTLSLLDALDVERQYVQSETSFAEAQTQLTSDWISLQSSLGLGWSAPASADAK